MKHTQTALAALLTCAFLTGCTTAPSPSPQASGPVEYGVKVHEFEGCECNSVCPCIFSSDSTFGDCRGITVFTFNGVYGPTRLKDVSCALVITWAGKNMEHTIGKWKGVLYTSDQGTPAEREAVAGLLSEMIGDAFADMEKRQAPIQITRQGDIHDLTVGTVARLRIHGVRGSNGAIAEVLNAPSPFAFPVMFCATADMHTYDDGESSWSFAGRNGFYADFELSSSK